MRTAVATLAVALALAGSAAAVSVVPAQKAALLDFAKATKSQFWNWDNSDGHWVANTDPCVAPGWDYVECDPSNGNILGMQFIFNNIANLQGNIPASISKLTALTGFAAALNTGLKDYSNLSKATALKSLLLVGNGGNNFPGWVTKLTNLEVLALTLNLNIKGAIPSDLSKMTKLQALSLSGNKFTGKLPVGFSKLTRLFELDVAGNQLTGNIPKQYSTLLNLGLLIVDNNKLTGPIPTDLSVLVTNGNLFALGVCGNDPSFTAAPAVFGGVVEDCD